MLHIADYEPKIANDHRLFFILVVMGNGASSVEIPQLPEPAALLGTAEDLEKLRADCPVHLPGIIIQTLCGI